MSSELSSSSSSSCAQLSIIVDLISSSFDFKALYNHLFWQPPSNSDHHYWHFGGLRSFTIPFQSNQDEATIENVISRLKLLQNYLSLLSPFWILYKSCQQRHTIVQQTTTASAIVRKKTKLANFNANDGFHVEYTAGALVSINKYIWDMRTQIKDIGSIAFYHDKIVIDYNDKKNRMRKTFKADMIDRCVVIMTYNDGFTLFINMNGNSIDHRAMNLTNYQTKNDESKNLGKFQE